MPRVTKSATAKAKHKKVLSATKGHYGARSRLYKTAKQSNIKSMQYAFRDRKNKKRAFRALWMTRINAGARELGVSYSTTDDGVNDAATDLTVNWRNACDAWLFDMAKASLSMTDDGMGATGTVLTYDLFTHVKPVDGVTALLAMGFAYATSEDAAGAENTQMWLPDALLAVEASMTDWATVRAFVAQTHVFSNDEDGVDGNTGNTTDAGFGVGFGWTTANGSSVSLDMEVSNTLFTDPISTMTCLLYTSDAADE